METSTPVGSPMRRKLSVRANLVALEEDEEDLECDLKIRRLEAINKSTDLKRRSVAATLPTGLNAAQLAEHCKDCIKLSTENKINSKNAFSFRLIDFMAALTKKSDSEINKNFQVASCTLDASVKIYGYRVDAVHTEAMKMAGGFFAKENKEEDQAYEDDGAGSDNSVKPEKKKLKKRKKLTVVAPNTLNVKTESEALLDVAPRKTLLSRNNDGSQLLTRIPKYNDGCLLMVDADVPCWPQDDSKAQATALLSADGFDPEIVMALFREIPVNTGDKISSLVSSVEFGQDSPEDDLELSQTSAFEFDINASVPEGDADVTEPLAPRLAVPCEGYDSGDEIAMPQQAAAPAAPASVVHMKRRLSVHNMEYSMFDDKMLKAWAGPTYWKVRPSREFNSENKENEGSQVAGVAGAKRTRKGRVKELAPMFEVEDDVLAHHLAPSIKTMLAKATLCSWKVANVTLGEDYQYTPKHLYTLFHLPLSIVDLQSNESAVEEVTSDEDDDVPEPAEELEYCSSQIFPDEEQKDEESEIAQRKTEEVEAWDVDNMVKVPVKVEKIAVGALHRRKHVDMKHLKKCIWEVLNKSDSPKEAKDSKEHERLSFRDLLKICPEKLPRNIASCMSTPMLFNALLHLTNERSLALAQPEKTADFSISLN